MNNIIEKLGSYQILTNLFPGAFFVLALKFFSGVAITTQNTSENIILYYFIGFIINRIGSLIVEPVLKKIKFIRFAPYPDFAKAEKIDTKITILSEINNYFRSLLTGSLLILFVQIINKIPLIYIWLSTNWQGIALLLLLVLFLFAYRKQVNYVRKRVESVNFQTPKKSDM